MTDTTTTAQASASHLDLTPQESEAGLDLEQLKQLVGLVEYDESTDPFPVTGWDAIVFVVGNATQAAQYYQSTWGMELIGYSGPETGNRDHKAFVLKSGSIRFVLKGGVDPESPLHEHVRQHGDGVVDISLEVPDVDRCIEHARGIGWRDIEVEVEWDGRPALRLHGRAAERAAELGVVRTHLSLTHADHTAAAFVVLEG